MNAIAKPLDGKLIAVTEDVATAGATVWWRLSGDVKRTDLADGLEQAGLPEGWLPEMPSPEVCLRRAVAEQRQSRRLVRPLKGHGWAVVEETADENDVEYETQRTVRLDMVGHVAFSPPMLDDLENEVCDAYERYLYTLTKSDISTWLVNQVEHSLDSVSLRERGGIYFIPHSQMDRWRQLVHAVTLHTENRLWTLPTLHCDDAVNAVLDAVVTEAEAAIDEMTNELLSGALGQRALETREEACGAMARKIRRYEQLLGCKIEGLNVKLGEIEREITIAALALDAEE